MPSLSVHLASIWHMATTPLHTSTPPLVAKKFGRPIFRRVLSNSMRWANKRAINWKGALRAPFGSGCGGGGLATLASFLALVNHNGRFFEGSLNFFKFFKLWMPTSCGARVRRTICDMRRYATICDDMRRYAAAYYDMEQHTMQRYAKLSLQRFTTTCNAIQRYTTICNYM